MLDFVELQREPWHGEQATPLANCRHNSPNISCVSGPAVPTRGRAGRRPLRCPGYREQKCIRGNSGSMTARWHFGATKLDRRVAKVIARNATPAVERPARLLTWAADEHLLLAVSAGLWLASRAGDERERKQADHLVLSVVATAILPHLLKRLFAQERPDRRVVHGRRHGIPRSGKAYDAFPSGHAMHVGAVASAISWAFPKSAPLAWGAGRLGCCNPDRSAGALDDGCSRRPCDGSSRRKVSAASFTAGGHGDRSSSSSGLNGGPSLAPAGRDRRQPGG